MFVKRKACVFILPQSIKKDIKRGERCDIKGGAGGCRASPGGCSGGTGRAPDGGKPLGLRKEKTKAKECAKAGRALRGAAGGNPCGGQAMIGEGTIRMTGECGEEILRRFAPQNDRAKCSE